MLIFFLLFVAKKLQKLNFRTKAFIVFVFLSFLFIALQSLVYNKLVGNPVSMLTFFLSFFSLDGMLLFWFYFIAVFFLFKRKFWAWIFAPIPSLWNLFSPMPSPANPLYSVGKILAFFTSLAAGDPTTALLMIALSIPAIIIVIYSLINLITDLIKFENKVFDFIVGIVFIFFTSFSLNDLLSNFIKGHISLTNII